MESAGPSPRARPPIGVDPRTAPKRTQRNLAPETREKLSQLAKQRHREGRFGGSEFGKLGGRPRNENGEVTHRPPRKVSARVAKQVAKAALEEETAKEIIQVFRDSIQPNQPMHIRLKGAESWLGIEREETKLTMQEDDNAHAQKSREELLSELAQRLTKGPSAEILRSRLALEEETIEDADVIDEDDEAEAS